MTHATLRRQAIVRGRGLFTGEQCVCSMKSARSGGLRIARTDTGGAAPCTIAAATADDQSPRSTSITLDNGEMIRTVEHLLSALAGLRVTDALIEADGPEIPAGDGSARFLVDAILEAGLQPLDEPLAPITPREPIRIEGEAGAWIQASPAQHTTYTYELAYTDDRIPAHTATWDGSPEVYAQRIAQARTFCLEEEAAALRAHGLCTHLTPRDMLVFGRAGPIDNALRSDDEPARHKLLDLIGDLALIGAPVRARIVAHHSGHALNRELARRVTMRV